MANIYRFFAEKRPGFDIEAQGLLSTLQNYLHIEGLTGLRIFNRYDVQGLEEENCEAAGRLIFSEPQCDNLYRFVFNQKYNNLMATNEYNTPITIL